MAAGLHSCPYCGGPTAYVEGIAGTRTPVSVVAEEVLRRWRDYHDDDFLRNRLQRAEKIIVELRLKVKERENNDR